VKKVALIGAGLQARRRSVPITEDPRYQLAVVVANLTVGQQNLQSAYSGLVDVNFAQETTTFSTDQILMQSGISMLSQAQQTPSLVLKLLQ